MPVRKSLFPCNKRKLVVAIARLSTATVVVPKGLHDGGGSLWVSGEGQKRLI
jgi:hypothetical protein